MPQVPDAPDTSAYEADLAQPITPAIDAVNAPTTRTVGKGESAEPSLEERVNRLGSLYDAPPNILADLISEREHAAAKREKMNVYENLAAGLSGFLSSYGSGAHRAGAGLASMLSKMGEHGREEEKSDERLRTLQREQMMGPYQRRHDIASHILSQMEAAKAAGAKTEQERWKTLTEGQFGLAKVALSGEWDTRVRQMINDGALDQESLRGLIDQRKEAAKREYEAGKIDPSDYARLLEKTSELEGMGILSPERRAQMFNRDVGLLRGATGRGSTGLGGSGYTGLGGGYYLSGSPNQ